MARALAGQNEIEMVAVDAQFVRRREQTRETHFAFWFYAAPCYFCSALHDGRFPQNRNQVNN